MTTLGLGSREITTSNKLSHTGKEQHGSGTSFWPTMLIERLREVVQAVAPIGYQDENGFYFGQPTRPQRPVREKIDSII